MDDELREAPPSVVGAVAAGVAPLPFLAVYAVLFISRGTIRPVVPPDVGTTKGAELAAGLIALAALLVGALATYWLLDGRRSWLFVGYQAAVLVTAGYFLTDATLGPPGIPLVLAVTSLAALVLSCVPPTRRHLGRPAPSVGLPRWRRARPAAPAGSGGPAAAEDVRA